MASIKVNINSRTSASRTSTTFTEVLARFFLRSWHLISSDVINPNINWIETDENDPKYVSRKEVAKAFQLAITEMLSFYDEIYGNPVDGTTRWTRENIESHILTVIFLSKKGTLKSLIKSIKNA